VRTERLKHVAAIRVSNVDKKTNEGEVPVRLCNYTDVYYNEQINASMRFMEATATPDQVRRFKLRRGDVLLTKDSETADDIGVSAVVSEDVPSLICGYHLAMVRPRYGVDSGRFLRWAIAASTSRAEMAAAATGVTRVGLRSEAIADLTVPFPPLTTQCAIADYLDRETNRIEALIAAKRRLIERLFERCDERIGRAIQRSALVDRSGVAIDLRRVLRKRREQTPPNTPLVTAYRDGQVTLRSVRRPEGYTEAAEDAGFQSVRRGDVVIHGLDGFAGAIGTSEADGACSPVYHVCVPTGHGDPHYWGRMLRVLARTGYLALFVTSTRERAYDMRNWDVMGRVPVPLVPIEEQRDIGDQLRRIPPLRDVFEQSIALLKEHRQALVTTAGTGQLDIPDGE
jgi:type I restriction enzyme, S subunit